MTSPGECLAAPLFLYRHVAPSVGSRKSSVGREQHGTWPYQVAGTKYGLHHVTCPGEVDYSRLQCIVPTSLRLETGEIYACSPWDVSRTVLAMVSPIQGSDIIFFSFRLSSA